MNPAQKSSTGALWLAVVVPLLSLGSACPTGTAKPLVVHPIGALVKVIPLRGIWYQVKSGDTLGAIAKAHGVAVGDVEELNGRDRRDALTLGAELFIVKPQTAPASRAAVVPAIKPTAGKLLWPVVGGRLTSPFGRRGKRIHEGIDVAGKEGAPIRAAAAGKVLYAGSGLRGYGNLVIIRHQSGLVTVYAHNKRNLVREGQRVKRGAVIAELGRTGRSSGPHVHFEVRMGDRPVNPMPYFKKR